MRILLHICCGPCAVMPLEALRGQGHDVMGFFYNPNIQPYGESRLRLDTALQWADEEGLKLIVHDEYDPEKWLRRTAWREVIRCRLCFSDRMSRAAHVARKGAFDAFTSSLLYSKQQKHELIKQSARDAAAMNGVEFFYQDFRPFWKEGIERSKKRGMYRQQYCGCIFSERDRFMPNSGPGKKAPPIRER